MSDNEPIILQEIFHIRDTAERIASDISFIKANMQSGCPYSSSIKECLDNHLQLHIKQEGIIFGGYKVFKYIMYILSIIIGYTVASLNIKIKFSDIFNLWKN